MQFIEDGGFSICMVELSIAIGGGGHDPYLGELFELALNGAAPGAGLRDDFSELKFLVGSAKDDAEYTRLNAREQRTGQI